MAALVKLLETFWRIEQKWFAFVVDYQTIHFQIQSR